MKIAVFGSAFNPPTLGHKSVIDSLSHFDRILLVPSISHAWGKTMLPYPVRCQLVDAFIDDLDGLPAERSAIEAQIYQPDQPVTTYAVLQALQSDYPRDELTFVIGPDNLLKFSDFYKAEDILKQFSLIACPERISIRSTVVRQCIAEGRSVSSMITPSVLRLISDLSLYQNG